ncbi:MAG: hypothetical protein OHK0053_03770 [Microscillaceae bacterium]
MAKPEKKKKPKNTGSSIKVSDKLKDFDIQINTLGEIITNYDIDKINDFLNKNVEDKKLVNRKDNLLDDLRHDAEEASGEEPNEEAPPSA